MKSPPSAAIEGDPYTRNRSFENFYAQKVPVTGRLVVILRGHMPDRGLNLIPQRSCAVSAGNVHELIVSAEPKIGPGSRVDDIAYVGFVEMSCGGVLLVGDECWLGDKLIGSIAGYDYTHMPNHTNIVISSPEVRSGVEFGLSLGAPAKFVMPK